MVVDRLLSSYGSILLLGCFSTLFHAVAHLLILILIACLGDGWQDVSQVILEGGRHVAVLLLFCLILTQIAWLVDLFTILFLFVFRCWCDLLYRLSVCLLILRPSLLVSRSAAVSISAVHSHRTSCAVVVGEIFGTLG